MDDNFSMRSTELKENCEQFGLFWTSFSDLIFLSYTEHHFVVPGCETKSAICRFSPPWETDPFKTDPSIP